MVSGILSSRIDELDCSVRSLATNVEWLELKQSEQRPGNPPILLMDAQLAWDIWNERGRFMSFASDLHSQLNESAASGTSARGIEKTRQELLKLEARFHSLEIPENL